MQDLDSKSRPGEEGATVVLRALKKHWFLGSCVAIAVLVATIFDTVGQKRIYAASTTIRIDPNPPQPLGKNVQSVVDVGNGNYWNNKEYFGTQIELLKGRSIARETVRTLNLQKDEAFLSNALPGTTIKKPSKEPSVEDATSALMGRLRVETIKDSRLVIAKLEDADRERARRILSVLVDLFVERNVTQAVASTGAASEWLRGQTDKLKTELENSELVLHDYKKDKRILSVSLDDQSNMLRGEMQQLSEALTKVNAEREGLLSRVKELEKVDDTAVTALPARELLNSNLLSSLREDYVQAKGTLDALLGAGKGDRYPEVEAARARVEATRQALLVEVNNVKGALQGDLSAVTQEARGLSRLFEQAKQRALDLNILEIEYRRLERTKDNTEKLFGLVLERTKESELTEMLRFNNISVVEQPIAGAIPVRPRIPLNLAVGLLAGLILGLAAAIGREWLDRTIRNPDEIEEVLGVPLLGILPSLSGKPSASGYYSSQSRRHSKDAVTKAAETSVELMVHALPASNAAECARGIRTSLTFASPDKPYRSILVTSGSPSEGKTTVATTIAIAFAQTGENVLLVDCDLRRAKLHRVFKVSNAAGVSSALRDPNSIDSAFSVTSVPNLSLLPAGPHVPNPAEVLQSDSFNRLIETLKGKFDRVILDSPPVLVVTDAAVLASRADATVIVTRSQKTRSDLARQVVKKMTGLGAVVVGAVLNGIEEPKRKRGYYYGYYTHDRYGVGGEAESNG